MLNCIKDHLHHVISLKQHGFCTGRSCVTNLLEALDHIGSLLDSGSQVDTIYLNMSEALDKVSHRRLVHKLIQVGFGGNLLNWFCSYLSGRYQRVTALVATSDNLPVTSGVLQGSILGPALFLLYVNDLPEVVSSSSRVLMFADDTKIFREIKTLDDASSLQKGLGKLATWSHLSSLLFNDAKCKTQRITRKKNPILSSYKLNNTALELYAAEKDLGVWISKDLTWSKKVNEQSSRANKLLGYLKRNTRFIFRTEVRRTLYLALVRPHLGYATQIWAPQSIELIVKLECIQRRATKFILKLPYSSNISYTSRLETLNLILICCWHELLDLTNFFKLTHGLVNVNVSVLPEVRKYGRRTRSSNSNVNKYITKKCKTSSYQKSFLIRTSRIWNCLADELDLSSSTLASFKSVIFNYYKSALAVSSLVPFNNFLCVVLFFFSIAVFFNIPCFYSVLISIRARCNWPTLLRCPCQCSSVYVIVLFVYLAKLIK